MSDTTTAEARESEVRAGETVLDLGSGVGKACFMASQVVGPTGRVIGVDVNDDMLAVLERQETPWRTVEGIEFRSVTVAVCGKTYEILTRAPYAGHFDRIPPHAPVPLERAPAFPCDHGTVRRDPRETKGAEYRVTTEPVPETCSVGGGCC